MTTTDRPTACILCSENCGLLVETEGRRITRIRGDEAHPESRGYLCQKAARLDHYQNHRDRLTTPLERRRDGTFAPLSWDQAITKIAARLGAVRDAHGGRAIAYYGGGGQGNHLGGVYGSALRAVLDTPYVYSALAQEKTGDFWVNGELFGRQTCHVTQGVADADFVLFIGTNPFQSHGFPRARQELKALAKDPARTMVVVDPRRTETARMADHHLQLRPGTDAFLMAAMLGVIVQEGLEDRAFLDAHTNGASEVLAALREIPIGDFADRAGVDRDTLRLVARGLAKARAATVRADLGVQQSLHSTLNSYLEKLLFLVTGNFARRGTNNLHTFLLPLIGHSPSPEEDERVATTAITGMRPIGKLYPPNILPAEIDNDEEGRIRALIVDSANPLVSAADTDAYERAFAKLDIAVAIDVALTETAALCDFVLPAASQFEKGEATFFCLGFPENGFHFRRPLFEPLAGTLPEPEIHRRLIVALGALPDRLPLLEQAARLHRKAPKTRALPLALAAATKLHPAWIPLLPVILYQCLGPQLDEGAESAAVLWGAAQRYAQLYPAEVARAGVKDDGAGLGEALFDHILASDHGCIISHHPDDGSWSLMRTRDRKVRLAIPSLLRELAALREEPRPEDRLFPLSLMAGERRAYNANTIFRDPAWRRTDREGAVRVHPDDARAQGLDDGAQALLETPWGTVPARVEVSDELLPGVITVPHGYGLAHVDESGERVETGPRINRLTSADHCDPLTKTPYHKTVPARLRPL